LPRFNGYKKGLEDCGLPFVEELVYMPEQGQDLTAIDFGYNGAKELMKGSVIPDAIMAAADPLAIGAIKYLKEIRINIPKDISIIGFDNNNLCELIEPKLTTIAQPTQELGRRAAHLLLDKLNGIQNNTESIIYEGKIVYRDTT